MRCKLCQLDDETTATPALVLKHYRDVHPGERSPRRRKKSAGPSGASAVAPSASGPVAAPSPAGPDQLELDVETDEIMPDVGGEIEPSPPAKPSWRERMWGGLHRPSSPKSGERIPKYRRESTAVLLTGVWSGLGAAFVKTGLDAPVGRCLQFQAPLAGEVIESITKDTILDRALQPIARNMDQAEVAGALFALPALIFLYSRVPAEARPMLESLMEDACRAQIAGMVPVIKKKRARDAELARVVADLVAEGMLPETVASADDAVAAVLMTMFTGTVEGEPPTDPATNGMNAPTVAASPI